jgi:glycine/D-amino acid oxidase-like deaminating enzyme
MRLPQADLHPPPEPVPWPPRPDAAVPASAEVVVVGAGMTGASVAYRLALAGMRPLVIEAGAPASGASGRNAGMALAGLGGHFPRATALAKAAGARSIADYTCRSLDILEQLHHELPGGIAWRRSGSLDLATDAAQAAHVRRMADLQAVEGLDVRFVGRDELADLAPSVDPAAVVAAKWTPRDGTLDPFRLVYGLLEAALARGAQVVTGVRVERLLVRSGRAAGVATTAGDISAGAVVLAVNAWTPSLVPHLAGALTPIREHVCVTEQLEPGLLGPGFETNQCNEYWRQMPGGEIVIGGYTAADEGMGIGRYRMEVHPAVPPRLAELLGRIHPRLADARFLRCWSGLLDFATLEVPMAGPLPASDGTGVPGGFLVAGLTGHGHPYAPILGLLLAELIADGQARTLPLAPFDPRRYIGARHAPTWLVPFGADGVEDVAVER